MATQTTTQWALRLPRNLKLRDLDGCTLDSEEKCLVIQGVSYQLICTDNIASDVCALEPKTKGDEDADIDAAGDRSSDDDSSASDEEENSSPKKKKKNVKQDKSSETKKKLKTKQNKIRLVAKPTENYSLVETNLDASDAMLRTTTIDTPDTILRKAYRHIPQVAGLKRRWMPIGSVRDWKPCPVTVSKDDENAAAAAGGVVPFRDEQYDPIDIKAEIKDEPEPEAVPSRKRDRSTTKKPKKDKHEKKSKRKRIK